MDEFSKMSFDLDKTVVALFAEQVRKSPDRVAVQFEGRQLSYRELDEKSNQLAGFLRKKGVKEETLVPICVSRSLEMVIGIMGILKAGGAYVPIDPEYPAERIQYLLSDVAAQLVVTDSDAGKVLAEYTEQLEKVCITTDREAIANEPTEPVKTALSPDHLAYVIYTSGSTGRPKGVLIEHRNLSNFIQNQSQEFGIQEDDAILQTSNYAFDPSVEQIFLALCNGAKLVLIRKESLFNPDEVVRVMQEQRITHLHSTPSLLRYIPAATYGSLKRVVAAGEICPPDLAKAWGSLVRFYNKYGPTEATISSIQYQYPADAEFEVVPIGKPIANTEIYIVGADGNRVPAGIPGEIYIGGAGVARGYLNNRTLTAEKFSANPFSTRPGERIYKTGDTGKYRADGTIEFVGRIDDQVKIRGHRIELSEIETVLGAQEAIVHCAVIAQEDRTTDRRLVAYVVVDKAIANGAIRQSLASKLPEYMLPSLFVQMASLPLTANGKVDKKALGTPRLERASLPDVYTAPVSPMERQIETVWAELLQLDKVGRDDNFFELGGNSLLAISAVAGLKRRFGYTVPITKLYQQPTIKGIAAFLGTENDGQRKTLKRKEKAVTQDIAVIGMAGRFPGADSIDALWTLLKEGKETTHFFTEAELDSSIPHGLRNDPEYVKARGVINKPDEFDPAFFGINPRLAELMDPQHRIFLEIAWEALESAGYVPQQYDGSIGVFGGCRNNTYYYTNVLPHTELVERVGSFQVMTANDKDYIATRTAYALNLRGPAVTVQSACSTSLLAIAQAVDSIRNGQCDLALAGGAAIAQPINSGYLYQEGAMLSNDGHCRPFSADARGTVFSDGAGIVLLKGLEDARRDGDTILAVIKGVGINNDGGGKGSFTAPNAEGQAGAIAMALRDARVDPSTISYVEAHGTATPIGDPIEIEGLKMAFGAQTATQFCAIGSIKSNMGHLTTAAGVAGFIKTVLALRHKQIPSSIHYTAPNPAIDFGNSPFFVNTALTEWAQTSDPRRAGVSSFGVGGTNVHVVLEEYPAEIPVETTPEPAKAKPVQLITWSAKSTASRDLYGPILANYLQQNRHLKLADVAFSLQTTRAAFQHRRFAIASTTDQLAEKLLASSGSTPEVKSIREIPGEVVFLFPGQGSQYLNMGRDLYENEPVYRQAIDDCAEELDKYLETDIRAVLYGEEGNAKAEEKLKNTRFTQPALFVTEYALAKLWMSWGIEPSLLCGHSIGEFVAAHLAGVFSLADVLKLVAVRGRLVSELPRGSMLSVRMESDQISTLMPEPLSIAAINSQKLCVVAGHDEDIAAFASVLDGKGIPNRVLQTSHAFHSVMMEPVVAAFRKVVDEVVLNPPQKRIVSTVSGTLLTDAQATDPDYWAKHLRLTVRFSEALEFSMVLNQPLLIEVGPGNATTTFARQQAGSRPATIITSLDKKGAQSEYESLLKALGQLWISGLEPDWRAFYSNQNRVKVGLPTYAFDKKRYWVDPIAPARPVVNPPDVTAFAVSPMDGPVNNTTISPPIVMRKDVLINKVEEMLEEASGIEMEGVLPDMSFLEMGLDSLLLTQVSITLKKEFGLPITFRQLNEEYATIDSLVAYLDKTLPAEHYAPKPVSQPIPQPSAPSPAHHVPAAVAVGTNDTVLGLMAQQVQILAKQIAMMQGSQPASLPSPTALPALTNLSGKALNGPAIPAKTADLTPEEEIEIKKPFGASARIERQSTELSPKQKHFLQQLIRRYNQKTGGSKNYNQEHRAYMADPRVVSGFKPLTKELVYSIVINKSQGSRLWDVDGNEYIDMLNGFGSNMFGYQPEFVKKALHEQIEKGFEIGPQHELAGEVCRLICDFTGFDRAALCSTGSEAVLGAMRVARTVTGRSLVVAFTGSYHGIVDEVIVRGTKKLKSFPAAPGIMPEAVQNMLILDYGTDESLRIIRERAHELAAVLVEPVQSRRPEFVPIDFLKEVRKITESSGTALIFDEVITGFRMHPGGTQAMFGIKADLASYGKVVGGGIPIGIIAGHKDYMDVLDGGFWQYGDASFPEKGVTYFAGTFVRHPLALATAKASLLHLREVGPGLQKGLTHKAERIARELNAEFDRHQIPLYVAQFGSLWKIKPKEEIPYSELLFVLMRKKGIHIWDGFPCFITEAHTDAEIDQVLGAFRECIQEMIDADIFKSIPPVSLPKENKILVSGNYHEPPFPEARLGRDADGNPAWFMANPDKPGTFLQITL